MLSPESTTYTSRLPYKVMPNFAMPTSVASNSSTINSNLTSYKSDHQIAALTRLSDSPTTLALKTEQDCQELFLQDLSALPEREIPTADTESDEKLSPLPRKNRDL